MHEISSLIFFLVNPPHTTTANETLTRLSDSLEKLCTRDYAWIVFFHPRSLRALAHIAILSLHSLTLIYYTNVGLSLVSDWLNFYFPILIKDISA